jgi:hypothetical protein
MRACAVAERSGVPAVAILSTGFLRQGRAISRALGIPDIPIAEYPGTIPTDPQETIERKAREDVAPTVLEGLLNVQAVDQEEPASEPAARDVIFEGGLMEVNEHFEERLWTDGLPVIPPTVAAVERFLRHTPRGADEVLGVVAPDYREATVWSVAVNGVMAGCRPEYMPLLVAIVEAVADPEFRLQDAGATPGWEPLAIISGPCVKRLGFNSGPGLMRVGPRANTSVGRFLRLYTRNVAGLRTPPGTTDKASIGTTFNVAMAEDDDALKRIGWQPFRVDRGFSLDDDVVTAQSVFAISQPAYSSGGTPDSHLEALAFILESTIGPWAALSLMFQASHPLLLLGPSVARVIAEHGLTKDDVRQYLYDNARIEARWLEMWPTHAGADATSLTGMVESGEAPAEYAESADPHRRVRSLLRPEWTNIVVAGDPGRNQSRFYVNNHVQGVPVSKRVDYVVGP